MGRGQHRRALTMDPIEKRKLKRQAWMRLAAQRRRAGLLRGRVVALSLICFVVLWGIVFAQMATGNDPVLSGKSKAAERAGKSAREEIESTDPRETTPRSDGKAKARVREEVVETQPEEVPTEIESAEVEAAEEPQPELVEEPLVTSQS